MSRRKPTFPSATMRAEEAEEFMALLLRAQRSKHNCVYVKYFRKIGNRMMGQHAPEEDVKDE